MKRLFVAIGAGSLTFDPREAFKKVRKNLDQKEIEHRWVPAENYHITLNFLGEVSPEQVAPLVEELGFLARGHAPFELNIEGMGIFPSERSGRVVWVGVQNSIRLRALQADCEKALVSLGHRFEDRPYRPHLTVARMRSPRNLSDVISPLKNHYFGELKVQQVTLFESKAHGAFPVYEPLGHFPLGAA